MTSRRPSARHRTDSSHGRTARRRIRLAAVFVAVAAVVLQVPGTLPATADGASPEFILPSDQWIYTQMPSVAGEHAASGYWLETGVESSVAATATVTLTDSSGKTVADLLTDAPMTAEQASIEPYGALINWDGKETDGTAAPDGEYTANVTITPDDTSIPPMTDSSFKVDLDGEAMPTITAPAADTTLHAGDTITVTGSATLQPTAVTLFADDGATPIGTASADTPANTLDVPVDLSSAQNGTNNVYANIQYTDPYNNTGYVNTASVSYYLAPGLHLTSTWTTHTITPAALGQCNLDTCTAQLPYNVDAPATVGATITDTDGTTVRTLAGTQQTAGGHELEWDGRDTNDDVVPAGSYTVHLSADDHAGNKASQDLTVGVDPSTSILTLTSPQSGDSVTGTDVATFTIDPNVTVTELDVDAFHNGNLTRIGSTTDQPDSNGTLSVPVDYSALTGGQYLIDSHLSYTDLTGADGGAQGDSTQVTVVSPLSITGDDTPIDFRPDGTPEHDTASAEYMLSHAATVTSMIENAAGDTVATLQDGVELGAGNLDATVTWNGTDSNGDNAPNGTYTLHVKADDGSGNGTSSTAEFTREIDLARADAGTLTAPAAGSDISGNSVAFTYQPADGYTPAYANVYMDTEFGQQYLAYLAPQDDGTWTGTGDASYLSNGSVKVYVDSYDESGTERRTTEITLRVANPEHVDNYGQSYTINPTDPVQGVVQAYFGISQPDGDISAAVIDADGNTVRTLPAPTQSGGEWLANWDGRDDDGNVVPDGTYSVNLTATDPVTGTSDTGMVPVTVASVDYASVTTPAKDATLGDSATGVVTAAAGVTISSVQFCTDPAAPYSCLFQSGSGHDNGDGTWTQILDLSGVLDGAHTLTAYVSGLDAQGNNFSAYLPAVAFTEKHPKTIGSTAKGAVLTPNMAGSNATSATIAYRLNRDATVTATVADSSGTTVATLLNTVDVTAGDDTVSWDGTLDAGGTAAAGKYTLTISATPAGGTADTATAELDVITNPPATLTAPSKTITGTATFSLATSSDVDTANSSASLTIDPDGDHAAYLSAPTLSSGSYGWSWDSTASYGNYGTYPNGAHTATATLYWADSFGALHTYTTSAPITVDNPLQLAVAKNSKSQLIQPGGPGELTAFSANFASTQPVSAAVTVTQGAAPGGAKVKTLTSVDLSLYPTSVMWDGTIDSGDPAPDGLYTLTAAAIDPISNNVITQSIVVEVDSNAPGTITAPAAGETVSGKQQLTWTPAAGVDTTAVRFDDGQGYYLGDATQNEDGTWTLDFDTSTLDGPTSVEADVTWQTPSAADRGVYYYYSTKQDFSVDNTADIMVSPKPAYIVPGSTSGDGDYIGYFATSAAGLKLTEYVQPHGDGDPADRVRTLGTDIPSQGSLGARCGSQTVNIGGSTFVYELCDEVIWDGTDDSGNAVANGLYDVFIDATSASGTSATTMVEVGVDSRAPVSMTPAAGATVSDSATLTYTPTADFPAGADQVPVGGYGVTGVESAYHTSAGDGPRTTATQDIATGIWTADVDLPAGPVHGDFDFKSAVTWVDPFGGEHTSVLLSPAKTDETTLILADSWSAAYQADGLAHADFKITSAAADGQPVNYTIDTGESDGNGGTTVLTGTIDSPYDPIDVKYVYHQTGTYTPNIVVTDAEGHRRHDTLGAVAIEAAPPTATLTFDKVIGVAPLTVTATLTGTQPAGDPLTYTVDWGDGTTTDTGNLTGGTVNVTHTFTTASAAAGFTVVGTVHDGSATGSANRQIKVGSNAVLTATVANPGGQTTVNDQPVTVDASGSQPALGITDYTWDFGDGTTQDTGTDPTASHVYDNPGVYTVVLTTTDPDQDPATSTTTQTVTVLNKDDTSVTTISVTDSGGAGLPGVQLSYTDASGNTQQPTTNSGGIATIYGLPDGTAHVAAYLKDYLPAATDVTVANGVGAATIVLTPGAIGEVDASAQRISADLASQLGVDLNDPSNSQVIEDDFTFTITGPDGQKHPVRMQAGLDGNTVLGTIWSDPTTQTQYPSGCPNVQHCSSGSVGGADLDLQPFTTPDGGTGAFVTQVDAKAKMLKEFFAVNAVIINLSPADSGFSFTKGTATVDAGPGLGFPVMQGGQVESATQNVADIPAGGQQSLNWVLSGEKQGDWPVSVSYDATLDPVTAPITLKSDPATLHVYGTSALQMVLQAGDTVTKNVPYQLRVELTNVTTDAHVYGASVTMTLPTGECPKDANPCWTWLPGYAPDRGQPDIPDDIAPGQTVDENFYVLPGFSGTVDFSTAAAQRVTGDSSSVPDKIEPLADEPNKQDPPATFTINPAEDGNASLQWSSVKDAQGYTLYETTSLADGFGEPIADFDAGTTSTELPLPDDFEPAATQGPLLRTNLVRSMSALATGPRPQATMTPAAAGDTAKSLIFLIATKLSGHSGFDHPTANGEPSYTCYTPGASPASDADGAVVTGCLNKQKDGWLSELGHSLDLSGLTLKGDASTQFKLDTTKHQLIANGAFTLGITVPGSDPIPLVSYDKAITLDLSQPLTLSLSANSVLGLPVAASAKVTLSGGGVSEIDLTTKAPAMLGGASAALDLKSDQTHGLQVSSAHLDLGQVSIGKLTAGKVTLDYASGAPGGSSWTVSGTLSVPNVVSGSLNGSVTYDGNGKLTAGSLTLPSLKLVGLASVSSFTLATTDGMSWTGSGSATTAGGGSAQSVKFAYTVDESNGSITADITVGKLVVPDAFTLTGFALSYSSGSWSVKGSVTAAGGSKTSDLTGSFTVAADGKTTGSLSASNVPLAGIATVASLSLTFDSSTKTYSGDLSLTLPGGSAPVTFKASIVDGVLQSASADKLDLKLGAVNLTGASFSYDSTKHSYAVAASDANVANLVHLDDFSMSAQVGTSSWSFQVKGQVQSDGDKGASIDGSIDVADGSISSASLTVSGINIGHFLPLDAVSFSYTKDTGVWKGSAGKTGGPSVAIEIDMPGGTLTGGSLDIKDVELGGAAHISEISAKMDASGDWSFSGKADVGGDQDDLSVDLTYSDGTLTDAKITGKLSIKNLLTIDVTDASYTAATESYSLSVQLTMPGPEGGTVGGSIKIENGLFTSGSFSIDSNGPGVPLGEAVFLTGGSFTLTVSPTLSMGGTVDFTVGPRLPVVGAAVSGDVGLTWTNSGGAGTFTLKGDVKIGGQQIANGTVTYDTSAGTVVFDGTLGINVGVLSASGALHGSITPDSFDLSAGVTASLLGVASATAQVEITDTGISGCAQLNSDYNWHAGFTYQWGDAWPPQPLKGACDLGAFAPAGGASADAFSARALATPATRGMRASLRADDVVAPAGTFTVPDGQDVYAVEFVGSDAPPQITLTAPDGTTTFTTPADPADDGVQPGGRYVVLRDASTNTTYFLLDTPAAGTWTAQVVSGTVSTMAVAIQRPQPTVAASLSGSGSTRTLDYTVAPVGAGQSVQFVETASDGVSQYLGAATTDSAGSVTFTPLTDSGTHTVSAEVLQDGLVRTTVDLLTFTPSSTEVTTIKQPTTPPGTAPRIRLSAPATPVGAGDAVDLTATVTIPNSGADTGTVQCYSGTTGDDSDPLGTPVSLAVTGGAGSGTCVVTGLAEGVHSLWARFTGTDGTLDSAALPLSVRAASSSGGGATGGGGSTGGGGTTGGGTTGGGTTGGGTDPGSGLTPPPAPTGLTDVATGVSDTASGKAKGSSSGLSVVASGAGAFTVGRYPSRPAGTTGFDGTFLDLRTASGSAFTSITLTDCSLNGAHALYFWNGAKWVAASDQTYDATSKPPCVTVTINGSSTPSLSQLDGTIFAAGQPASGPAKHKPIERPRLHASSPKAHMVVLSVLTRPSLAHRWVIVYRRVTHRGHHARWVRIARVRTNASGRARVAFRVPTGTSARLTARVVDARYRDQLAAPVTVHVRQS